MVSLLFVPNQSVHTRYVSPKPFKKRVFGGQKKRKKEVTKKNKKTARRRGYKRNYDIVTFVMKYLDDMHFLILYLTRFNHTHTHTHTHMPTLKHPRTPLHMCDSQDDKLSLFP
jgi:hypothetical protein